MTTPREELIQAIEQSPDALVQALLELLRVLQSPGIRDPQSPEPQAPAAKEAPSRLRRQQGILVIETESLNELDTNAIITSLREERIQDQMRQVDA